MNRQTLIVLLAILMGTSQSWAQVNDRVSWSAGGSIKAPAVSAADVDPTNVASEQDSKKHPVVQASVSDESRRPAPITKIQPQHSGSNGAIELNPYFMPEGEGPTWEARMLQDVQDPLAPVPTRFDTGAQLPQSASQFAASVFGTRGVSESLLSQNRRVRSRALTADVVFGAESKFRASTDAGNLLGKSQRTLGVRGNERSPIITDTRIRGSHVGQLLASGSYWFPARPDLDTLLSKIDSRIVEDMIVIKGPYAARYGPGFNFIDIALERSPRYAGYESHGSSIEYKTNGDQWYGRQTVWGGSELPILEPST
jgi:hypothetical protein